MPRDKAQTCHAEQQNELIRHNHVFQIRDRHFQQQPHRHQRRKRVGRIPQTQINAAADKKSGKHVFPWRASDSLPGRTQKFLGRLRIIIRQPLARYPIKKIHRAVSEHYAEPDCRTADEQRTDNRAVWFQYLYHRCLMISVLSKF